MELKAKDLTCERGGRIVFRNVSLALRPGQLMQLTGPNGSGKSSLLRLIAGLNEAQAGEHRLEGGAKDLTIGQQAHYIAHQEPVKTALSVHENLAFWRDFLGGGEVEEALEAFDLGAAFLLSRGAALRRAEAAAGAGPPRAGAARAVAARRADGGTRYRLARPARDGVMARQLDKGGMIIAATHVPLGREPDLRLDLGSRHEA